LKSYSTTDPDVKRQKAITPKLLRALHKFTSRYSPKDPAYEHATDLIIGSFFFANRVCEYARTPIPGQTRPIRLGTITFRNRSKKPIDIRDPGIVHQAEYVTIKFEAQKNGVKNDRRTQRRTKSHTLCPVRRFARAVTRLLQHTPNANSETPLYQLGTATIHADFIRNLLRTTCSLFGGKDTFGFDPSEIGNKSLRSGAAMALFLNNHSPYRIMLLGRWKSLAFLAYIRPQVIEWTNNMSHDMINLHSFADLLSNNEPIPPPPQHGLQDPIAEIPELYLLH
jgi:hypothetical protein